MGGAHLTLFLIALAGALGALARYGLGGWVHGLGGGFPWGTLVVNVLGSFLLGLAFRTLEALAASTEIRHALTIGFLGSFTTFSAFSFETVELAQAGEWGRAALYAGGSVLLGVAAAALGIVAAGALSPGTDL